MTLQECYEAIGGSYEDVSGRLRKEALFRKFVLKFLDDPSYDTLCQAMESKNQEEAFRAAHTLKGVCQNLAFSRLYESSRDFTEQLRPGQDMQQVDAALFARLKEDYRRTADAIRLLDPAEA